MRVACFAESSLRTTTMILTCRCIGGNENAYCFSEKPSTGFENSVTDLISEPYLAFVRQQSCVWCSKPPPSDPDHIRARGWREPKRNDYATLPSCRICHSVRHQIGFAAMLEARNLRIWQLLEYQANLLVEFFEKKYGNHVEVPF